MRRPRDRRLGLPLALAALTTAAIAVGLLLPGLVSAAQIRRTDRTHEYAELGSSALSLSSDEAKLEKLGLIKTAMERDASGQPVETMTLSTGRFMTEADAAAKLPQVQALVEGTGLDCGEISERDLRFGEPILVVGDAEERAATVVWTVYYSRDLNGEGYQDLYYILDDASGLIIGAGYSEIYYTENPAAEGRSAALSGESRAMVERIRDNLATAYHFTDTELILPQINTEQSEYQSVYYIDCVQNGRTVFSLPVSIGIDGWMINFPF